MRRLKNFTKPIVLSLAILIASLIGGLALPAALAWVGAPANPPDQNVSTPLNVGPDGQSKAGGLILNTGGATNGLIVDQGNVGIGTTTPGAPLEIESSSDGILRLRQDNGGWNYIEYYNSTARTLWMGMETDSLFGINGQIYLDTSNGNVGIGTAAPNGKLQVQENGVLSATDGNLVLYHPSSGSYSSIVFPSRANYGSDYGYIAYYDDDNDYNYWGDSGENSALILGTQNDGANSDSDIVVMKGKAANVFDSGINYFTGKIGIGVTNPSYKLDVASGGAKTARFGTGSSDVVVIGNGNGKLTAATIDPVYDISGKKFATYTSGMTGVKEETTGNVNLKCQDNQCVSIIDFRKQEKGSDLWLFYQITDFGKNWQNLVVLLTPQGNNRVWYELNPSNHQLLIYGAKKGGVSYRLTAPRFDHQKWSNLNPDKGIGGMKIETEKK